MKHINFHSCINFYSCIDFHVICTLRIGEDCKTGNRYHFAVALWAVFDLPQDGTKVALLTEFTRLVISLIPSPSNWS